VTEALLAVAREGLWLAILIAAPVLVASLLAGVVTGLVAAVTQVQDASISLVPRVAAAAAAIVLFGPSVAKQLAAFAARVLALLPTLGA
jgi:flagellar biosynthesis protein FliQ